MYEELCLKTWQQRVWGLDPGTDHSNKPEGLYREIYDTTIFLLGLMGWEA